MKNKNIEHYAKTLYDLRKSCGLTQKELSELSGVSVAIISKIENGSYDARISTCLKIEQALNLLKIYINTINNRIMETREQRVSYLIADNNREEFYKVVKALPCFKMTTVSKDRSYISCLWDENYENQYFEDDDDVEIEALLSYKGWYSGDPLDMTEEQQEHSWAFYCGTGKPIDITQLTAEDFYTLEHGTGYQVDGVTVPYFEDFKKMQKEENEKKHHPINKKKL